MLFMTFIVVPLLGVLWFLNLITFMENLHNGKNTHYQKVLGGVWTAAFIGALLTLLLYGHQL